jgi:ADP-heptose:LPS heptosyltransferase
MESGRRVVITGTVAERTLARRVAGLAGIDDDAVLAGRTDVMELAAVVAAAGRVLCGDTGIAHLATAFGIPSVVLFGPTSPAEWGPPPERGRHRVLWAGRTGDPHAARVDDGLLKLCVSDVIEASRSLDPAQTGGRP